MDRWGRNTDIDWVYQVRVSPSGNLVGETYHGRLSGVPHATLAFTGLKEGLHPLLLTSTDYNDFDQVTNASTLTDYRFFLSPLATKPTDRTREYVMDSNPWTYRPMADEMWREGQVVDTVGDPVTQAVSDPKNYLYVELNEKGVSPSARLALAVQLARMGTEYALQRSVKLATQGR